LGTIYRRGTIWWIRYWYRSRDYRESSHSDNETVARRLLKRRLGEIGRGRLIGPSEDKVTFDDLANALVTDYQINAKRSVRSVQLSILHLERSLGPLRAVDISTDRIRAHILERQKEGAANASINRELSALKRMFSLAVRSGRISQSPYISMLQEDNTRQGF